MTLTQVWGAFLIFTLCPLLGGIPLISWITRALTGRRLQQTGTGNISVSAAFYHGGRVAGILAVLSEALKGILAVLLARQFFPQDSVWEIIALIGLVMGRYWFGRGAGTTNVVWGYGVHDPIAAGLVLIISGISFTIWRERRQGRMSVLVLFPLMTALLHPQEYELIGATIALAILLGWIYRKIPDDLNLPTAAAQAESQSMFQFFRGDRAVRSLDNKLDAQKVGQKAATLSQLKRLGYTVPMGWVLLPGDDPEPLIQLLQPSPRQPLVVRSSAVGEDSETASAAGQYETVLSVTSEAQLMPAISRCLSSYDASAAVQYRRDRNLPDASMAVLIQKQIRGVFSGVAFSRDPISRQGDAVLIEALPGSAAQVVSGQVTPESYRVFVPDVSIAAQATGNSLAEPDLSNLTVEGSDRVPRSLMQQVAWLARQLEAHYHGVPQDVEWSYDGQVLWLLQTRPITTLLPIWTRKIASEVIPGLIPTLTWSINRPLTCGVWGKLFTLVLANRAAGLDFNETATLHYSRAYFNASLLGQIFRRMGLPPESLEFLTRGATFSKPPLRSTLQNVPGLLRLLSRELSLEKDFQRDDHVKFAPAFATFTENPVDHLSAPELLNRVDEILNLLTVATYYSILAPLSAGLRKAIFKVNDEALDNSDTPEVAALRSLQQLAVSARQVLETRDGGDGGDGGDGDDAETNQFKTQNSKLKTQNSSPHPTPHTPHLLWDTLAQTSAGQAILDQFNQLIDRYGYLSEVGTDIAVPTWKEDQQPVRELFTQFCLNPPPDQPSPVQSQGKVQRVQRRIRLKGRVTEVYSRLLAELRWSFVALEKQWLETGQLSAPGDIFYLELEEVRQLVQGTGRSLTDVIAQRRAQLEQDQQLESVPFLVYGDDPPAPAVNLFWQASQRLQGIGASAGIVAGQVRIVQSLTAIPDIDKDTILVVPYTDSGWAPLLARAGGLIAEVGGRLSHGAIVAREYRIPAVMDIHNATQLLHDGQQVRIDGQQGIVEIL